MRSDSQIISLERFSYIMITDTDKRKVFIFIPWISFYITISANNGKAYGGKTFLASVYRTFYYGYSNTFQ